MLARVRFVVVTLVGIVFVINRCQNKRFCFEGCGLDWLYYTSRDTQVEELYYELVDEKSYLGNPDTTAVCTDSTVR